MTLFRWGAWLLVCGMGTAQAQAQAPVAPGAAAAQEGSGWVQGLDPAQERARLSTLRREAEATHAQEVKVCYQRFAVTDCKNAAQAKLQAVLTEVRRQENILKDNEHRQKGSQALQRLDERNDPTRLQEAERKRLDAVQAQQERQDSVQRRQSEHDDKQAQEAQQRQSRADKERNVQGRQVDHSQKQSAEVSKRDQYNQKQEEARQHRLALEKRNAERSKPAGETLPTPSKADILNKP